MFTNRQEIKTCKSLRGHENSHYNIHYHVIKTNDDNSNNNDNDDNDNDNNPQITPRSTTPRALDSPTATPTGRGPRGSGIAIVAMMAMIAIIAIRWRTVQTLEGKTEKVAA